MFRSILISGALQLSALFANAQAGEVRELPPFTKISIESISKVTLHQGPVQKVVVTGGVLTNEMSTSVSNGTLLIDDGPSANFDITVPVLERVSIKGKGTVVGDSVFTGDNLQLDIGGDGKITMNLDYKEVKGNISGLGKITLSGKANAADFNISGSGKVDALDLQVANCNANISGLGKCTIDVTDNLNVNISGSGSIVYKNAPKNMNQKISGAGSVRDYQASSEKADTTYLSFGSTDVIIIAPEDKEEKKSKSNHRPLWAGFEMGINTYVDKDGNFSPPAGWDQLDLRTEKSVSVSLNVVQQSWELGRSNIWFTTGLGITWNNYRFDNNVVITPNDPLVATVDTVSGRSYSKSKLTATYITAPLMFQVLTSRDPDRTFHISAGGIVGLRIGSHTKTKYDQDGDTYKSKDYGSHNLNPFRYGARVSVGYNKFALYGEYYFSQLFQNGHGPEMYPVNFGVTLIGF